MRLRYRIWHLLLTTSVVALSLPLAKWLLALEAMDHPKKQQTPADFVGFYLGAIALVVLPLVGIVVFLKRKSSRGERREARGERRSCSELA
jgi:hypothetical protein